MYILIHFKFVGKTYDFKKGYSRSKSSSTDSDERNEEPEKKRKKIMTAERLQEIESISEVLKGTTDQIAIKRQRLERGKRENDFTLCDQLNSSIVALLVEKRNYERQLLALKRKEAKSKSHHIKKALCKEPTTGKKLQRKPQPRSQDLRGETVTKTLVKFILSFQNFGKKSHAQCDTTVLQYS